MSQIDKNFVAICEDIFENGYSSEGQDIRAKWDDGTPAHTIKRFAKVTRYNLAEEFPAMTLRPVPFKTCIDELLWIWQKKSNNVKDLNSHIWDAWADETGSIGKGYGYQLSRKYQFKQGEMDQVDNVLYLLKNDPTSRRIMTNIYAFDSLLEMGLEPCAYSMTFNVTENKLNGILNQRSQDTLTAFAFNEAQYAALICMLAQVSGLEPGEFVHVIADCHLYDRHIELAKSLCKREQYPAPKLVINPDIKNWYDFSVDDIQLENYKAGPQLKGIPVAV